VETDSLDIDRIEILRQRKGRNMYERERERERE
jgi:hypothetical protein